MILNLESILKESRAGMFRISQFVVLLTLTVGCAVTPDDLMPTPNLYLSGRTPFADVPVEKQDPAVRVIYATDRARATELDDSPYGYRRLEAIVLGEGTVDLGADLTWDSLVDISTSGEREEKSMPTLRGVEEFSVLPDPDSRYREVDGRIQLRPEVLRAEQAFTSELCAALDERLAEDGGGEVFMFIHGYNVSFDLSLTTIAEIWHFLGRKGVTVAYSWPSGRGGLRGYTTDRESGEFTVFHLKQFMRALLSCECVKKLHIIAHSRGSDVLLAALREVHLESRSDDGSHARESKIGHIVLAAPDLDVEIFIQRIFSEGLFLVPETFTVYLSHDDRALGVATWLFDSVQRLGRLQTSKLSGETMRHLTEYDRLFLVDARVERTDFYGHSYFYRHPAVSSDLILLLKHDRLPCTLNGRPLILEDEGFWAVYEQYPNASHIED